MMLYRAKFWPLEAILGGNCQETWLVSQWGERGGTRVSETSKKLQEIAIHISSRGEHLPLSPDSEQNNNAIRMINNKQWGLPRGLLAYSICKNFLGQAAAGRR